MCQSRILLQVHGIKVAVILSGTFHQFRMIQFLVTLTTALGLLAVARVVVDNLMLYVLPNKERYQQAKYETVNPIEQSTLLPVNNTSDHEDNSSQGTNYHECPETIQQHDEVVDNDNINDDNRITESLLPPPKQQRRKQINYF